MAPRVSSPVLAGRAAEVAQLRAALERARSGSPAAVVVAGEAGVGKTRLVEEVAGHARAAVADGVAAAASVDHYRLPTQARLPGVAAEAAAAERAAARHDDAGRDQAARAAAALLTDIRANARGSLPTPPGQALLLTAEAEAARAAGSGDPDRWQAAATAWEALDYPWPAAYARWRQAEALLGSGAAREQAAASLRQAWATAGGLGARLLLAEVEALGRRARIGLAPDTSDAAAAREPAAPGTDAQRLGLTPRELEVLALVADGRTNRQIAEALFISDKTASVHVSNILAKLGVANRAEAAVTAHRLGLTPAGEAG